MSGEFMFEGYTAQELHDILAKHKAAQPKNDPLAGYIERILTTVNYLDVANARNYVRGILEEFAEEIEEKERRR